MQLPQNPIIIYDGILQAGVVVTSLSFVGATIGGFPGGAQVTVGGGGGGANTALSNLAVTAVNADIQPAAPFTLNSGSSALPWSSVNSLQTNYLYTRLYQQGVPNLVGATLGWESTYYVASQTLPSTAIFAAESAKIISIAYDNLAIYSANDALPAADTSTKALYFESGNKINGTLTNVVATGAVGLRTGSNTTGTFGTTGAISILSGNKLLGNAASGGTGPIGLRSGDIGISPTAAVLTTTATGGLSIGSGTNFYNVASLNNTGGMTIKSGDIGGTAGGPWINGGTTGGILFTTGLNYSTTMVGTVVQNRTGGISFNTGASSIPGLAMSDIITGSIGIRSGSPASGQSGNVTVGSGNSPAGATGTTFITSGTTASAATTGSVNCISGSNTGTGNSGSAVIRSGPVNTGVSGYASTGSGDATAGQSGNAYLFSGAVIGGVLPSGEVNVTSGANSGTGNSGQMHIWTGNVASGDSGVMILNTGDSSGGGDTGNIYIYTGFTAGLRGSVSIDGANFTLESPSGRITTRGAFKVKTRVSALLVEALDEETDYGLGFSAAGAKTISLPALYEEGLTFWIVNLGSASDTYTITSSLSDILDSATGTIAASQARTLALGQSFEIAAIGGYWVMKSTV